MQDIRPRAKYIFYKVVYPFQTHGNENNKSYDFGESDEYEYPFFFFK